MTDLIKTWLNEIIGVPKDIKSEAFVCSVQNGSLIAQLLHALCIINDTQLETITKLEESQLAFNRVCTWLEELGFRLNSETKSDLAKGKLSTTIRLFYQLYLTLKRKDKPNSDRKLCNDDKPAAIEKVKGIDKYNHILQFHKTRYNNLLERCKKTTEDYQRYTKNLIAIPKTKPIIFTGGDILSHHESLHYTYDQLIEEEQKAKTLQTQTFDSKVFECIGKLRRKRRQLEQQTHLKSQMEDMLLDETWRTILQKKIHKAESDITKEFLAKSSFEKETILKQLRARENENSALEVRKATERAFKRQRDEELMQQIFSSRVDDHQACRYYFERDMLINLHRMIYAEKLHKKAKRISNMCGHALEDLVDLALAQAEYLERHGEEMGQDEKGELQKLFVMEKPIYSVIQEPYLQVEEDPEEIVKTESDVNKYFQAYCDFQWPWELTDQAKLEEIKRAGNILGHIVFRLLLTKYPKPLPPPPPPNLPKFQIAVCVRNLTDPDVLRFLEKLLAERNVKLIRMEDALNFCVKAYELATAMVYTQTQPAATPLAEENTKTEKGKKKGKETTKVKKNVNVKKSTTKENEQIKKEPETKTLPFQEKQVQTPKMYPCEVINLSPEAELGGYAGPMTDEILTKMFLEYIKSLKDLEGWVIVNYPQNFQQMALLEEALTGRRVPPIESQLEISSSNNKLGECEHCECPLESDDEIEKDTNQQYRSSRLLTNPHPPSSKADDYRSYLTAYIQLTSSEEDSAPWIFADENTDDLHTFYLNQGNLYTLYYKTLDDFATMKHLAKLIIGDYSIPPKTSVQIFGDTILQMGTEFAQGLIAPEKKQKEKPKNKEKEKLGTSPKKDGKPKKIPEEADVVITRQDKETQFPEVKSEVESICGEVKEVEPKPGEANWKYVDLEIPDFFEVALATLWENIEETYVDELKDLFLNIRTVLEAYVPYVNYVKQYMLEYIARADDKQLYLQRFQSVFNEFDESMRGDEEVKAELQCRLYQFREKMWGLCDERLWLNEEQIELIAQEDWLARQTSELSNAYFGLLQLEANRTIDTLSLLDEYYMTAMTKAPTQECLENIFLTYIPLRSDQEHSIYTKYFKQVLLGTETSSVATSPFHKLLNNNFDMCIASAEWHQETSLRLVHDTGMCLQPKSGKAKTKLVVQDKGHFEKKLPQFSEPPSDVKQKGPRLLEEWTCAINGEVSRVKLRCELLKSRAHLDLQNVIEHGRKAFGEIRSDIAGRYRREMESVQNMYDVFSRAITEENFLQLEMVFTGDRFYMSSSGFLFEDKLPLVETHGTRQQCHHVLSLSQLNDLVEVFMKAAPTGAISMRAFTLILQDLIASEMLPPSWQLISMKSVSQISEKFFGKSEVIDWRDFIVYNMDVDFPSEEQLLKTRNQFRMYDPNSYELVGINDFNDVKLWFANYDTKSNQIKKLLCTMFKTSDDTVNYTALLLAFCKDESVVVGVAKALELVLGKYVCWQDDVGEAFKESMVRKKELEEEQRIKCKLEYMEKVEDADAIMESLIDGVVHACDSCLVEEINSIENEDRGEESKLELQSEKLSNEDIGFEANPNPPKVYYLPFEVLEAVFLGALPWCMVAKRAVEKTFREKLEIAYEQHKNRGHDGQVLAHEFLNSEVFLDLLKDSFKFIVREPSVIIEELVNKQAIDNTNSL